MRKILSCMLVMLLLVMTPILGQQVWAADSDSGEAGEGVYWSLDSKGTLTISGKGEMESNPWLKDYAKVIKKVVVQEGVTKLCYNAFYGCTSLSQVSLPTSLRVIGDSAFDSCTALTEIVIPEGVTTIEYEAFWCCEKLDSVTIPSTVTEIGGDVFGGLGTIENVYISSLDQWCALNLAKSRVMHANLYLNKKLVTELVIPQNVTSIPAGQFDGWTSLKKLTIPDHVISVGQNAFDGCTALEEVNIGNGITAIQTGTFGDCPNLTKLTLPSSILAVNSRAFYCSDWNNTCGLTEIRFLGDAPMLASDALEGVTATAYYSPENDSWTEGKQQNYGGDITWVADPSIPGSDASDESVIASGSCGADVSWSLTSKGVLTVSGTGAIEKNPWLADYSKVINKVVVDEGVTKLCYNAFYGCTSLTDVFLPNSLEVIGDSSFDGCTSLTQIVIPEGVTTIEYEAFWCCEKLDSVTIPSTVTEIGGDVFGGLGTIENVYISSIEQWCALNLAKSRVMHANLYLNGEIVTELVIPDNVTTIPASQFDGWTSLEKLVVPDHVTQIGQNAFDGCVNLKVVELGDGITAIQNNVFGDCPSLTKITFPDSILVVNSNVFHCSDWNNTCGLTEITFLGDAPLIASDAFKGVTATVRYSDKNASWTKEILQNYGGTITWVADSSIAGSDATADVKIVDEGSCGDNMTWSLNSLGVLNISGSGEMKQNPWLADYSKVIKRVVVNSGVTKLCYNAFYGCTSLTDVSLPTSLRVIGDSSFDSCTSLTEIVIPEGVTTIEYEAFWCCEKLDSVTIPSTVTEIGGDVFGGLGTIENVYISSIEQWCALNLAKSRVMHANLYLNGKLVTELVIPENVTSIPASQFDGWTSLEKLVVPDHVKEIGQSAFDGCVSLKEVELGDGITAIQNNVFGDCPSLTEITFPTSILVVNSNVFHCSDWNNTSILSEIRFLGDAPLIAADAFTSVKATAYYSASNSSWTEDLLQNYGGTITWQADSRIPGTGEEPVITIIASGVCGGNLYWELNSQNVLRVYGGKARTAGGYAMDNYSKPEDAPWYEYSDQIEQVVIENTVSSVGTNAFSSCEQLTKVVVEENVQNIGQNAFSGCSSLEDVNFMGDAPKFGENCFGEQEVVVRYPAENDSWSEDVVASAGSNITLEAHTHDYLTTVIKPTCIKEGYTKHVCVCGDTYTDAHVKKLAHKWGKWEVVKLATANKKGEQKRTCSTCGGEETKALDNPFVDLKAGMYYEMPVMWAVSNGITNGYDTTHFAPDRTCTRGQVVTFLWRAAGEPKPASSKNPFVDVKKDMYYYDAVLWAVEKGITTGADAKHFEPDEVCTRGQVATFLWRTLNKPEPSSSKSPFDDVPKNMYYYTPVLWAVEAGVTNGTDPGKFAPEESCTRGQIVTFLHRALG